MAPKNLPTPPQYIEVFCCYFINHFFDYGHADTQSKLVLGRYRKNSIALV